MTCPNCGTENATGKKFCTECGMPLALACASCGAPLGGDEKFCGECGTPVSGRAPAAASTTERAAPASERRLVSVLFADLVGFTTLSETRDSEEVRELLSRYFDTCRTLIGRYGGVVEKFIGDAVMAVWGTPVAREDDAERAVRAALDLVDAVAALGQEIGAPDLRARAGVLTGEAAVTIGAEGQGMVAGDLVNTASRIQSAAAPGQVFVGEATRRSTEAAIAYEDAGEHELKGKAEPVRLHRALRVVAAIGGLQRSVGLEAPFVGRERELRMIKDLFHASAEDRKAHLVSITGVAGTGKSRLRWEFEKYIDGLVDTVRFHLGRCLAYGDGVTYWALAEMVRTRAGILEGEEASSALAKLQVALEKSVPDPEERRWVEPRLAHLLGLEDRVARDREDLFAAWRLFYERLSEELPTAMVFEDMQWADAALLDFIDYLLEWSKDYRLFIFTLARPELVERRPNWGTGRSSTAMYLEPLRPESMEELLAGLVPGLPEDLRARILDRAQGIPLYAVETVRMLLDRGLLAQEGAVYRPTGPIDSLDVPETLHALLAARLDGLEPKERRLVQDASVLGKTFTKASLAALSGLPEAELDERLSSLMRKEVFTVQADPRSPERGQYGFLQELVKTVAYETLSKKERRTRHLAVAEYLESAWAAEEEEIVEVLASHLLDAHRAAPDADDASEIKARARDMLGRAGERAASLAASEEAQRYFEQAAELAEDRTREAELLERAGQMAWSGGRSAEATSLFDRAMALFESEGRSHPAARVSARLAEVDWRGGRIEEAVERMERAFQVLVSEEPDEDLARLAAELGRLHYFMGQLELAGERTETALEIAEPRWLPEVISEALNTKALIVLAHERREEAMALLHHAVQLALENDLPPAAMRGYVNLSDLLQGRDRYEEALEYRRLGVALARKTGSRFQELLLVGEVAYTLSMMGRWDDAVAQAAEAPEAEASGAGALSQFAALTDILAGRGELDELRRLMSVTERFAASADVQERGVHAAMRAVVLRAEGNHREALAAAEEAFATPLERDSQIAKSGFVETVEAALSLGDFGRAEEVVGVIEGLRPAEMSPFLQAQASRLRAKLSAARGEHASVEAGFKTGAGMFREIGVPFWLAVSLLEHGDWLVSQGRAEEAGPLLEEAREIFEGLKAQPWLERLEGVQTIVGVGA
ncbi:MAG: AAA family ATPase [Actinomycetota bacterium]|nr:AAA family ATPase [Actinomycetota bacterium]